MYTLIINGNKIGEFKTLVQCYRAFEHYKIKDWIILKEDTIVDKND